MDQQAPPGSWLERQILGCAESETLELGPSNLWFNKPFRGFGECSNLRTTYTNVVTSLLGGGRGCCLKFLKPRKAKGKLSACCTFHLPFLMDTFGSCCAGSVISPYPWAFPGSFSLLRGTGSIMEEGASRGRGTKEGWRIWEVGEEDPMSWKKKGLGMDGHLTHPCFLPLYPWPF